LDYIPIVPFLPSEPPNWNIEIINNTIEDILQRQLLFERYGFVALIVFALVILFLVGVIIFVVTYTSRFLKRISDFKFPISEQMKSQISSDPSEMTTPILHPTPKLPLVFSVPPLLNNPEESVSLNDNIGSNDGKTEKKKANVVDEENEKKKKKPRKNKDIEGKDIQKENVNKDNNNDLKEKKELGNNIDNTKNEDVKEDIINKNVLQKDIGEKDKKNEDLDPKTNIHTNIVTTSTSMIYASPPVTFQSSAGEPPVISQPVITTLLHPSSAPSVFVDQTGIRHVGRLGYKPTNILGIGSSGMSVFIILIWTIFIFIGTVVYEGTLDSHRIVAIKRILRLPAAADALKDKNSNSLIHIHSAQREIRSLIKSDAHANIIRYYAMEEDDNFIYLALEYCIATAVDLVKYLYRNENRKKLEADERRFSFFFFFFVGI
jgi:hypothetical protein